MRAIRRGWSMSPIQTAAREPTGGVRPYPPADVLFAPPEDLAREIVVDWQLPSDMEKRRR